MLYPEDEGDIYNLGVISTNIASQTEFTETSNTDEPEKKTECKALLIEYTDLTNFLINNRSLI